MKNLIAPLLISLLVLPMKLKAQQNIPITGADEELSQYICVTILGVKTFGIKIIQSNGTVKDTSVKGAKAQIDKQIQGLTKKILKTSDLLKSADTKKKKEKLQAKISSLRNQRDSIKFIKTQISLCEKSNLEFKSSTTPELFTNVTSNPVFQRPLNLFMYGFKFTIPKVYEGTKYCVSVSNAATTPNNIGGIIYSETGEQEVDVYKNCQTFGMPIGDLCVNGIDSDEGMIILTQGAFEERDGNCTSVSLTNCSLNNFRNLLSNHYSNTRLTSFRPGTCD